jgi:hypothetical protein
LNGWSDDMNEFGEDIGVDEDSDEIKEKNVRDF